MKTPRINIKLKGIEDNARILRERCASRGVTLTGVVKGAAGDLRVMDAFLRGGLESLGDSRLRNIVNYRKAGFTGEIILLRLPQLNEADQVVKYTDISLVSEITTVIALNKAAAKINKVYGIIIMVDVGDLREGVLPEDLTDFIDKLKGLPFIEIKGIGTNVGCYGGVLPSVENTEILVKLKKHLEEKTGVNLPVISGGNTATTILLEDNSLPEGINHLRVGEAILQGTDITNQRVIEGMNHHNFTLTASIIEIKKKPSVPTGKIGCDAFGNRPQYTDKGIRKRAILAVGRQDMKLDGLTPVLPEVEIMGASSDHLLVDITELKTELQIGDEMEFYLDYGAMLASMTSPYVFKNYLE